MEDALLSLSALTSLLPAAFFALSRKDCRRGEEGRNAMFWLTLVIATTGPIVWIFTNMSDTWQTGLSMTFWIIIAVSMIIFAVIAVLNDNAWRLTPLLIPYMVILASFALFWQHVPEARPLMNSPGNWIRAHILISVTTYALVTIAAVSALAAFMQERSLKTKRPTNLTRILPSVAESESLLVRLLIISEVVLGLGLVTGMATQYQEIGSFLNWDHKAILSLSAFSIVAILLAAHYYSGIRGRKVTRFALLAYLLLTLSYPGVKFVTDVLIN
jgi:ABC-type uncharacterized transport system permease subunit